MYINTKFSEINSYYNVKYYETLTALMLSLILCQVSSQAIMEGYLFDPFTLSIISSLSGCKNKAMVCLLRCLVSFVGSNTLCGCGKKGNKHGSVEE